MGTEEVRRATKHRTRTPFQTKLLALMRRLAGPCPGARAAAAGTHPALTAATLQTLMYFGGNTQLFTVHLEFLIHQIDAVVLKRIPLSFSE